MLCVCTTLYYRAVKYNRTILYHREIRNFAGDPYNRGTEIKYTQPPLDEKNDFHLLELMKGVYIFSNVCIEALEKPNIQNKLGLSFNETARIVVYHNGSQPDGVMLTLETAGSGITEWNQWDIHFQHKQLSQENIENLRDTAFFVEPRYAGNFHHFFVDEYVPLFSVITFSKKLHPGANNQILYRTPQRGRGNNRSYGRKRFEEFLRTLYTVEFHDVFYNLPNTCFRNAIFGARPQLPRQRDAVDHLLKFYNLSTKLNRNDSDMFLTIIDRSDRRMLNVDDVATFAKTVGFRNVRIVDFDKESLRDQLHLASTTNVFIGVQGAGLQWASFMPNGSYLIELAWPQKNWIFFFEHTVKNFGINWVGVSVDDVRLNWTTYAIHQRRNVPVKEDEKPNLIKTNPRSTSDNIWKWADFLVKREEIFGALEKVYNDIKPVYFVS